MLNQTETKVSIKKSVSTKSKKQKILKCPFCDVTSYSSPGLKGHITKKHQNVPNDCIITTQEGTDKANSELINSLLDEVIDTVNDENNKVISLEENCETIVGRYKKYKNKCEDCNYCVESDKKYAVVQTMLKHKREACNKQRGTFVNCDKCDFKAKDSLSMKRHTRDIHDISTASTSPPPKRKRKTAVQTEEEEMEVDNKECDKMEIDEQNKTEEEIHTKRSDLNDRKNLPKVDKQEKKEKAHINTQNERKERCNKNDDKLEPKNQITVKAVLKEKKEIENEYFKCVNELALKTEECEKLKIEIKDLKQLLELKNKAQKMEFDITQNVTKIEEPNLQNKTETVGENEGPWQRVSYKTKKRQYSFVNNKSKIPVEEEEYNCTECPFQGTSKDQLEKHIKIKHRMTCRNCDESFKSRADMMVHRKEKHGHLVANCRNYLEDKCPYTDLKCWWNHRSKQSFSQEIKCFVCEEKFENKPSLMIHRKEKHIEIVRKCYKFEQNSCRFQDDHCWFKHEVTKETDQQKHNSVFQNISGNLKPPIRA